MVDGNQRWYLLRRAETALELATRATDPDIAAVHMELHARFLRQAGQQSSHPRPLHLTR